MGLEHVRQYQCRTSPTTQASLGEKNHCSSAWPAAVIGQSLPTSTIPLFITCASDGSLHDDALPLNVNHEGWNDVIQLSTGLSWIVSLLFLGLQGQTFMAYVCRLSPWLASSFSFCIMTLVRG